MKKTATKTRLDHHKKHSTIGVSRNVRAVSPVLPSPQSVRFLAFKTIIAVCLGIVVSAGAIIVLFAVEGRNILYQAEKTPETDAVIVPSTEQFPLGVFPNRKEIVESPDVDAFFAKTVEGRPLARAWHKTWFGKTFGLLASLPWYQNLASPSGRVLLIQPGERREEVVQHFASVLGWSREDREHFLALVAGTTAELPEGNYFPGTYSVDRGAPPEAVAPLVISRFSSEVFDRYGSTTEREVALKDALTIASLLEREAYDFTDMREISGIIWKRVFAGMNLQIDATLQYAKANSEFERKWWPKVLPADKFIASVYNTYQNSGLPPAPIANPSLDAILAALNPRNTSCLFYFHDPKGKFYCTETYEDHVTMLKQVYGRGR